MNKLDDKDLTKVAAGGPGSNLEDLETDTVDSGSNAPDIDDDNDDGIHDLPGRGGGYRGAAQG